MEKFNIAYLVSPKCEEGSHYSSSSCLLCQRCWLPCTSCAERWTARKCEDSKCGAPPGFFIPLRDQLRQQTIQFYKI